MLWTSEELKSPFRIHAYERLINNSEETEFSSFAKYNLSFPETFQAQVSLNLEFQVRRLQRWRTLEREKMAWRKSFDLCQAQ